MTGTAHAIPGVAAKRAVDADSGAAGVRVVIAGGGFGGAYAAQALEKELRSRRAQITLIDRHNYFVFYPLLVEAGTGSLEPRHAVVALRAFLNRSTFRMAEITGVDFARRRVQCIAGTGRPSEIPYDHLVLALGSVTSLPPVPGLAEHGFELKSLTDAVALRDRAIEMLELADATLDPERRRAFLHFVVVGGNFSGVEVAGEFDAFLKAASRSYPDLSPADCQVTLVELSDRILRALDPDLSEYATRQMRRRGIDIRVGTTIKRVEPDHAVLADDTIIGTHTVIWCAGIAPNPLLSRLNVPLDERGYVICEPDLRVATHRNVWGIGDCAINRDPDGSPYPATAQHAVRQAAGVARNIRRVIEGAEPVSFVYRPMGSIAAIGCRSGVAKIFGVKLAGFPAWFLYRTVYLWKMPGWGRRVRIAIDWTMDLFFRREYVQLRIHRR